MSGNQRASPLRACLLSLCPLWLCASLSAATYVVSPRGDNAQAGGWGSPLKTISAAAERAQPGDTVLVREGVYRERVTPPRGGRPGSPIVYRAQPGDRVVIKGSNVWRPDWKPEGDGVYSAHPDDAMFDDRGSEYVDHYNPLKVQLASTPEGRAGRREHERGFAGDADLVFTCGQVIVDGQPLREVPFERELEAGNWWYDANSESVLVHFGRRDPQSCVVELTTRRRLFAPSRRGLGHIVVEGFVFEHCGNQYPTDFWRNAANAQRGAVGAEAGHHWTVRGNVIRYAKTSALDVGRVDRHRDEDSAYNNRIEANYIIDNGSAGIVSCGSRGLVVRGNVILRNNRLRFHGDKRWEHAGVKCHLLVDGLIEGNYIAHNEDSWGIWLDNQFPDSRITRNVIHHNGRAGVFLEMSDYGYDRLLVDNNLIFDNHENAVYIHDASGATFANNLIANTPDTPGYGQGVLIQQVSPRTTTSHHTFVANLLIGNARNVEVNFPSHRSGPQRFDGNLYDVTPESRSFAINDKSDQPSPWSAQRFRDLFHAQQPGGWLPEAAWREPRKALLNFEEWRSFWRRHGESNDLQSRCSAGNSVGYDPHTHTLTIELSGDPPAHKGGNVPPRSSTLSGLEAGVNQRTVWQGPPLVGRGELPAADWRQQPAAARVELPRDGASSARATPDRRAGAKNKATLE